MFTLQNDTLKLSSSMCTLSHTVNSDGYTVTVAATTRGGRGPYSDNIYVYIPKAGKYYHYTIELWIVSSFPPIMHDEK